MSFKLGDIIVDRVSAALATDLKDNPLYVLTQLSDATIDITADPRDASDANGGLVKRFYSNKTGTFTANNAFLNLNVVAGKSGSDAQIATADAAINMPRLIEVKAGATATLTGYKAGDKITVNAVSNSGALGKAYTLGTGGAASETEFVVSSDGKFTPPTDKDEVKYLVRYQRNVTDGVKITNSADKFPKTIKLLIKALVVDPCEADTIRAAYIELPSFQPTPETNLQLTTDQTIEYNGDLQVDYCSEDKALFHLYYATDDEEEA